MSAERVELQRDCQAVAIPAGHSVTLTKGTEAYITQSLGGAYTLQVPSLGGLFRVSGADGEAIGKPKLGQPDSPEIGEGGLESQVWTVLRTCFDPEIPVNIVDLGLVYDLQVVGLAGDKSRVEVKMTLTAPGCGMGVHIAADARQKILDLPGVEEADVEVVWEPPWNPQMISPEGRQNLGME